MLKIISFRREFILLMEGNRFVRRIIFIMDRVLEKEYILRYDYLKCKFKVDCNWIYHDTIYHDVCLESIMVLLCSIKFKSSLFILNELSVRWMHCLRV